MELIDTRIFHPKHVSCIQGKYNILEATEQMNQDYIGKRITMVYRRVVLHSLKSQLQNLGALYLKIRR